MLNNRVPAVAIALPADTSIDPLVALVDAYFTGVKAYGAMNLNGMPGEDEMNVAERLFGWAKDKIENPEPIQSHAGALALVNYLIKDNVDWGQEAWAPMLSALRAFLEAQDAKETTHCVSAETIKAAPIQPL